MFEKIPTEGISEITITASSLIGERDIKLTLGDSELTVKIAPSDGYEDFGEYTAKLTEAVTGDTLTVTMGGECCLLGVRIN